MDNRMFRDAMGKFATGITVVTTEHEEEIIGMTVNAFMSISLDPHLIAVSIGENASMYEILQQTKQFGVSILAEEQKDLSMIFAKQIEQNQEIDYVKLDEIPVIKHSLVTLACHVKEMVKAGDHMVFIAEVTEFVINEGTPILYADGAYRLLQSNE